MVFVMNSSRFELSIIAMDIYKSKSLFFFTYITVIIQMVSIFFITPYCARNVSNLMPEVFISKKRLAIFDLICVVVYFVDLSLEVIYYSIYILYIIYIYILIFHV